MKSYSVKSNAKRFARGIAAKHPGQIEAVEPTETGEGDCEWYPTIRVIGDVTDDFKVMVFDSCSDAAVIHGIPAVNSLIVPSDRVLVNGFAGTIGETDVASVEVVYDLSGCVGTADLAEVVFIKGKQDSPADEPLIFDAATIESRPELAAAAAAFGLLPSVPDVIDASNSTFIAMGKGKAELAALAAGLPPRVESSAEDIAARRAERRNRIDAEKVNPVPKPVKINKTKIILDLIKRKGGATQEELEGATGWQRHTLRGFIAGTLRKRLAPVGMEIECIRAKGEPTRYVVPMMEADRKGGEA